MRDPADSVPGRSRRGIIVLAAGAGGVAPLVGAMVARGATRQGTGAPETVRGTIGENERLGDSTEPAGLAAAVRAADRVRRRPRSTAEIAEALYYQATAKAAQDDRAGARDGFRRAASSASGRLLTAVNVALEVCQ